MTTFCYLFRASPVAAVIPFDWPVFLRGKSDQKRAFFHEFSAAVDSGNKQGSAAPKQIPGAEASLDIISAETITQQV